MKKFISVFIILLMINIFVPVIYYQVYYNKENGQLETPKNSDKDNFFQGVVPDNDTPQSSAKDTDYQLYNLQTKQLDSMDIISFLVGSSACEVPVTYEVQAIKAQMIACHSYYLYCKENGMPSDDLNLSFDEKNMQKYASKERLQEYWGLNFDDNYQKFLRCAQDVKDIVVTYQDKVALTPYFAVSCGKTQSSEKEWGQAIDYLVMQESQSDAISDNYLKIRTFTVQEMYDRFMASFSGFELNIEKPEEWIGEIIYNQSGYVDYVNVANAKINGRDFRKYFDLPSTCFMIFLEEDTFSIATKGYGHGVGLSQFGANQLSQQGKTYEEILQHYFKGVQLKKLQDASDI